MKRRFDSNSSESPEASTDTSGDEEEIDVVSPETELASPLAKRFKSEPRTAICMSEVNATGVSDSVLEIVEQPRQRGFRFRYPCEGPCHGELRGEHSEPRRKTYPTVRLREFTGRARVVVSLVCHDEPIRPHAHCLVGRNVVSGQCTVEIGPETNWTASFPRLSILHIPKKNAARVLLERYALARVCGAPSQRPTVSSTDHGRGNLGAESGANDRMALELQLQPGSREQLAGGAAALASLPESERRALEQMATEQARGMNLNVVRLCFQAFLPDEKGRFTTAMPSCISQAIYDTKAASSSALRIYRLDRHSGSVMGGDEIFMLCDRVQKDDIVVRFYEDRTARESEGYAAMNGLAEPDFWEADGVFSPNDVHRQSAIVFKTPPYWNTAITRPTKVWVALKRRSEEEMGEAQQFTYLPPNACQCSCHKESPMKALPAAISTAATSASPIGNTPLVHAPEMTDISSQVTPMVPGAPSPAGLYYFGLYNTAHALTPMPPIAPILPFYGSPAAVMPSPAARLAIPTGGPEQVVPSVK